MRRSRFLGACAAACVAGAGAFPRGASAADLAPIAFVPLDDRPVTLQLPVMFGQIAGIPVVTPPRAAVGSYLQPGDTEVLARWLQGDDVASAGSLVASTDMVAYGGLVASRIPGISAGEAYQRLRLLARLKKERGLAFSGAFGTIMRLAPTGVPDLGAAKGYYATGDTVDLIQTYANLPDPPSTPDEIAKAERLRARIGEPLNQYLATRARNLAVDEWALQLAAEGGFDRLVLGQDDAGPVGLHLKDVAELKRTAAAFGLAGIASIEPGADELGMVMLARAFALRLRWTPAVRVSYSRPDGASVNDRLEFVPIGTTIAQIVVACGAAETSATPDIELFVRVGGTADPDESAFEDAIVAAVAAGRSVAVADLSFLDGQPGPEQQRLTDQLIARGVAGKIDAFASWNTDANTIGTALPEAIVACVGRRLGRYDEIAHAQFMLDRYADDYAFHQFVRPDLNETLRAHGIDTTLLLPDIAAEASSQNRAALWPQALDLLAKIYPQYKAAGLTITLPWDRTFETRLDVRLAPR